MKNTAYVNWNNGPVGPFHTSQEAFQAKDERITMKRDSWDGGYTVQFTHFACNVVSMAVSGDVISYSGRWM